MTPAPPATPTAASDEIDNPVSWEPSLVFLRLTIRALLVGAGSTALALLLFAPEQPVRVLGPALVGLVGAAGAVLLRRGRVELTRQVLAYGVWSAFAVISVFTGDVRSPVVICFPLIILMCGWQIGARAAALTSALSIAATALYVALEIAGWLPQPPPFVPIVHGSVQVILALLSAALIVGLARAYNNRLHELRAAGRDLAQQSAELQRAQAVASVGSWVLDLVTDRIQLSAETCRIFDLPAGTVGNKAAYLARVVPPDRELVAQAWAVALRSGSFDHEHRILAGSEVRWVRQKAEFEFGPDGTPLRAVGITQNITARRSADEKIAELAFFDQLSGLPNRTLLRDRLQQAMTTSVRDNTYSALLFLDLDNFKTLNDTMGHDVGDLLLCQVAQRLHRCVRAGDTVARLGGDEFVVMLTDLSHNQGVAINDAEVVGEKVLASLSSSYTIGMHEHRSSASIGITLFGGTLAEPIDEPLKRADLAMYQAKAAGRSTLRFFDPKMQAAVSERAALERGLRAALVRDEFVLHFQPQLRGDGVLTGAEALVRWQHPQRGLVLPGEFIALAEETGLILPLGQWVLESACAQLKAWSGEPALAHLTMAVNVSARQFRQSDFVSQVLDTVTRSGANPKRLKLELTETLLVANVEDIIAKMLTLKAHGIGFALDDFGTGYSSLAYLSRLPLDQLKIDRSFVTTLESNDNAVAICAATISLAHSLGLKVVAEGVESGPQLHFLHDVHACDFIQGYLFSRPLVHEQFQAFARQGLHLRADGG